MVEKADKIWMDGKFVDWDKANVHVLTHALHYGSAVFEGIKAYEDLEIKKGFFVTSLRLMRADDLFFSIYSSGERKIQFAGSGINIKANIYFLCLMP